MGKHRHYLYYYLHQILIVSKKMMKMLFLSRNSHRMFHKKRVGYLETKCDNFIFEAANVPKIIYWHFIFFQFSFFGTFWPFFFFLLCISATFFIGFNNLGKLWLIQTLWFQPNWSTGPGSTVNASHSTSQTENSPSFFFEKH